MAHPALHEVERHGGLQCADTERVAEASLFGMIRAACNELGLSIEGESVVGLQLISSRAMLAAA